MKYDFTSILDRRGKDAIAVELVGMPYTETLQKGILSYSRFVLLSHWWDP